MPQDFQSKFLNQVVGFFETKSEAVEEIGDSLTLGKDAVYRRLRGDTALTAQEIQTLAQRFNISIDSLLFEHSDMVFFTFNAFQKSTSDFESFLSNFSEEMLKAQGMNKSQFYYASVELPLFLSMFIPELFQFKVFIWGRTALDFAFAQERNFDFNMLPITLERQTSFMLDLYMNLPSTELWSADIIDNTLNQIEYYLSAGCFNHPEDALCLCDKLTELTSHMQRMAKLGKKFPVGVNGEDFPGAPFRLYHNEMVSTNNTILAKTTEGQVVYTTLSNPNFLKTNDSRICAFIENWFERLIRNSAAISEQSERTRDWFFNRLRKRIEFSKKRIEQEIAYFTLQ